MLDLMSTERSQKFGRPRIKLEGETEQEPLRNLELWDLVLLYSKALKGTRLDAMMSILYRDVPLEVFIDKILNTLLDRKTTSLHELLGEAPDRTSILGTFLALLQLAKIQKVTVEQDVDYGDIRVEAVEAPPAPLVLETAVPSETAVIEKPFGRTVPAAAGDVFGAAPARPTSAEAAPAATSSEPRRPRRRAAALGAPTARSLRPPDAPPRHGAAELEERRARLVLRVRTGDGLVGADLLEQRLHFLAREVVRERREVGPAVRAARAGSSAPLKASARQASARGNRRRSPP
jgi:hypothetical protein